MKLGLLLLLLLFAFPVLAFAGQENPWDQKLPFKTATIKYAISGMEEGTEILYIKDYGQRTATYHTTVTSMLGMKMENSTIEIEDPEWVYSYDLQEGTGMKSSNPKKYMKEEYEKLSKDEKKQVLKNTEQMGMSIMEGMGGAVEQKVTEMFGFKCDRATIMGTTVYSIHKTPVPLKTEANVMGMKMSMIATSFDKGKVDEKYFSHPRGVEAIFSQEADDMARSTARQTIAWLKDPEASKKAPSMQPMADGGNQQQIPPEDQEIMKQAEQMMEGLKGLFGN